MKLVRFGKLGEEKPGLIDADGAIRDLSGHVPDLTGATLSPASLARLRAIDPKSLPAAPAGARIGAPVAGTRNFIAVGLNYADHAKETGQGMIFSHGADQPEPPRDPQEKESGKGTRSHLKIVK